jgi:hypothetical protein
MIYTGMRAYHGKCLSIEPGTENGECVVLAPLCASQDSCAGGTAVRHNRNVRRSCR